MAANLAQHLGEADRNGTGSSTTIITVASVSITSGNRIVVGLGTLDNIGASASAVDNLGNTYTQRTISNGTYDSVILDAPVTAAGTLTSITVTTANSVRYVAAEAAEFSGVGAYSGDAAGSATDTGASVQWADNITIPADGIVIGFVYGNVNDTYSAGAASGTPSTTPVLVDAHPSANGSGGMFYALGGSGVTGFTGNAATAGAGTFSCVGAIYEGSVAVSSVKRGLLLGIG